MSVHRTRPLPMGPARGRLLLPATVLVRTTDLLLEAGKQRPAKEGLVLWVGRTIGADTLIASSIAPAVDSGPQHVFVDERSVGHAAAGARRHRLGIVAQAHSHPGDDTRHSDGDDDLVLMPFEGMFSMVVSRYGRGSLLPSEGAGLHQFQSGRWVLLSDADDALVVLPTEIICE